MQNIFYLFWLFIALHLFYKNFLEPVGVWLYSQWLVATDKLSAERLVEIETQAIVEENEKLHEHIGDMNTLITEGQANETLVKRAFGFLKDWRFYLMLFEFIFTVIGFFTVYWFYFLLHTVMFILIVFSRIKNQNPVNAIKHHTVLSLIDVAILSKLLFEYFLHNQ